MLTKDPVLAVFSEVWIPTAKLFQVRFLIGADLKPQGRIQNYIGSPWSATGILFSKSTSGGLRDLSCRVMWRCCQQLSPPMFPQLYMLSVDTNPNPSVPTSIRMAKPCVPLLAAHWKGTKRAQVIRPGASRSPKAKDSLNLILAQLSIHQSGVSIKCQES